MIRIGIVGCGRILAAHLRGYRLLREAGVDGFRITALCARRPSDAQMYVRRGQGPPQRPPVSDVPGDPLAVGDEYLSDIQDDVDVQVFSDYRQMVASGSVDAVNDFTPHDVHHQVAEAALGQRLHLLTQKPLAVTVAAGRRMVEQAEAADCVLAVFENARNRPDARYLHWLHHGGPGGPLRMILMGSVGAWWTPRWVVAGTAWRHRRSEGGGITLDLAVHRAHLIRYLAGEIADVDGRTSVVEPIRYLRDQDGRQGAAVSCDADDTCLATFRTQQGAIGNLFHSWSGCGQATVTGQGMVFYGAHCYSSGNEVTLESGDRHALDKLYRARSDPAVRARDFPLGLRDPFALNQYDWLEAIRSRRPAETSGREGLRDLAAAFAILESDLAGRRVDVEEVLRGELRAFQRPLDERFGLLPA